jgi:glycosyltransferase involved in cell wall biosynthesis
MKVVVDAYQMRHNITGTDRQARNILRELQNIDHDNEYIVIVNRDEPFVSEAVTAANFHLYPVHFNKRASWIYLGLPLLLLRLKADAFYSFHNFTAPGLPVCPSVVSALDLIPFMYQKRYYQGLVHYWVRRPLVLGYMRNAAKTAAAFWANSNYTKQQTVDYFHVDPKRFKVAYLQADPVFESEPSAEALAKVRAKLGVRNGFVYAIGGAEPRKNNLLLIEAHRKLSAALREQFPLVIAGAKWQGEDLAESDDQHLILAGYVSDDEHALLYHAATVFVCASTYEGFGLPVLEAMTAGAPVIASGTTSLPEVASDAAIFFDPDSAEELAQALRRVLTDDKLRTQLRRKGLERNKDFSWHTTAATIHELIVRVARQ